MFEFLSTCSIYGNDLLVLIVLFLISATVEAIDVAKNVIKKLTFNFQSDAFENPSEWYITALIQTFDL